MRFWRTHRIIQHIKRLWRWHLFIWREEITEYDYADTFRIWRFALESMRKTSERLDRHISTKRECRQIRTAELLLQRLHSLDYEFQDDPFREEPAIVMEIRDLPNGCSEIIWFIDGQEMTPEQQKQRAKQHQERREHGIGLRNQDIDLLASLLKKHSTRW